MKNLYTLLVLVNLACINTSANTITLIDLKHEDHPVQIPVNVDVTDKILNIIITGNFEAEVIVTGPDGVVYQSRINAKNYHSVSVDLRQYADGDYTITFYDMEGNVIEGEFLLGYK